MIRSQLKYPLDLAEMEQWIRSHTAPGQRVLEIGCGDGELVRRLADDFDVLGIDPGATASSVVRAEQFEELDELPFDVIFASVSLHHLADLGVAQEALRRLSKPGTTLLVREFDRLELDHQPTLQWWFDHTKAQGDDDHEMHLPETLELFMPQWREMMHHHVMPWPDVREMLLASGFETVDEQPTAYLFRWGLSEGLRAEEERLAADGTIKMVGRRWTGGREQ
jgi:ubiquinone/menaquinone biosynthesis C-methylase UbiE